MAVKTIRRVAPRASRRASRQRADGADGLLTGLGWLSFAVAAVEILAPGPLATLIGIRERPALLRLIGLREIATGVGTFRRMPAALWGRVAGDAMDLGLLGLALAGPSRRGRVLLAGTSLFGVTVLDVVAALRESRPVRVQSIAINRPVDECRSFWRDEWGPAEFFPRERGTDVVLRSRADQEERLRRMKAILETGEVPTTEGQPAGRRDLVHRTLARLFAGGVS